MSMSESPGLTTSRIEPSGRESESAGERNPLTRPGPTVGDRREEKRKTTHGVLVELMHDLGQRPAGPEHWHHDVPSAGFARVSYMATAASSTSTATGVLL